MARNKASKDSKPASSTLSTKAGEEASESSRLEPEELSPLKFSKHHVDYLLQTFDIVEEEREFLEDLILSGKVPKKEMQALIGIGCIGPAEDWMSFIQYCLSIRNEKLGRDTGCDGLLYCIGKILNGEEVPGTLALREDLFVEANSQQPDRHRPGVTAKDAHIVQKKASGRPMTSHPPKRATRYQPLRPAPVRDQPTATAPPAESAAQPSVQYAEMDGPWKQEAGEAQQQPLSVNGQSVPKIIESVYFSREPRDGSGPTRSQTVQPINEAENILQPVLNLSTGTTRSYPYTAGVEGGDAVGTAYRDIPHAIMLPGPDLEATNDRTANDGVSGLSLRGPPEASAEEPSLAEPSSSKLASKLAATSPYFNTSIPNKNKENLGAVAKVSPKQLPFRPPRGTISALPIPSLSAISFGLVQEYLTHKPFQLLVAVTFLIRTQGKTAIPVFQSLMARYPTPEALAAADSATILGMIQHLGLGAVRCAAIQRYAHTWVSQPPRPDVRYAVKNYPRPGDGRDVRAGEEFGAEDELGPPGGNPEAAAAVRGRESAWEIGHLTQGPYAIDSWRIFCRDVFLGRAQDWMGKGRDPQFQPEWMRVLPQDKELRACLRWMWMREGWEWDPVTGEREVLREELRRAVDEGRVGYDTLGQLCILDHNGGGGEGAAI